MYREFLTTCWPGIVALAVSFFLLAALVHLGGGQLRLARIRRLHSCEVGGVQSLSMVLTLPFFIMITMFIIQISQLMIGMMVVNHAAFAAARSAIVWVPAQLSDLPVIPRDPETNQQIGPPIDQGPQYDQANRLDMPFAEGALNGINLTDTSQFIQQSRKCREIFTAAAMTCATVSPSREHALINSQYRPIASAMLNASHELAPTTQQNSKISDRFFHKISYAMANTAVRIEYHDNDTNSLDGPATYNPIAHPSAFVIYHPHEVGWQDVIEITVTHNFALLPGPGSRLAKQILRADGQADTVSPRVNREGASGIYQTPIVATVSLTNEGLKSVRPYQHAQ